MDISNVMSKCGGQLASFSCILCSEYKTAFARDCERGREGVGGAEGEK